MTPFKRTTQVTTLPPTIGIKDPEVRAFLDAMVNAWDLRSGVTNADDRERFVTLGEIKKLTNKAIVQAFSRGSGVAGGGGGIPNPGEDDVSGMIDGMVDSIRQSILYQLLGTSVAPIDITNLRSRIDAAIGEVGATILREQTIRSSADEAFVSQIEGIIARVEESEAAIFEEQEIRLTKDTALARAINTMWAAIGGDQAVIQDGQLAAVTPSAVQASRWTQVVASVTDPNTGQINSTSIKQDLNSYASKVDGKFNSIYSVRAQVDVGGRTVVGGFGLSATAGAGSAEGPTIDFGVRADRFWIAATSGSGDVASQMSPAKNEMPFIVVTSTQTYNGITYQPGVYMKSAFIVDASITNAKIGSLIYSNNFDGAISPDGKLIITNGTQGWAIDKSGNAVFNNLVARGTLLSDNYSPGFSGWRIDRSGSAEFNGIILSRPNIIRSGVYDASGITVSAYIQDGFDGRDNPISRPITKSDVVASILIDTGYNTLTDVGLTNGPGFCARVLAIAGGWHMWWAGGTPASPTYNVYPDVSVGFYNSFGISGVIFTGEYGRVYIRLNVAIDLLQPNITQIRLGNFRWELARLT